MNNKNKSTSKLFHLVDLSCRLKIYVSIGAASSNLVQLPLEKDSGGPDAHHLCYGF